MLQVKLVVDFCPVLQHCSPCAVIYDLTTSKQNYFVDHHWRGLTLLSLYIHSNKLDIFYRLIMMVAVPNFL